MLEKQLHWLNNHAVGMVDVNHAERLGILSIIQDTNTFAEILPAINSEL